MANEISLTVAKIRPLPGALVRRFDAGGTLTPGQAVYIASDGDVEPADGSAVATLLGTNGIVVSGSQGKVSYAAGDRVDVVVHGPVTGYSGMTPGAPLYVHDTAGVISEVAGTKKFFIGYAESAVTAFVRTQISDLS